MDFLSECRIDTSVLIQSAMPLLIALVGLFMTGSLYDLAATQYEYATFPIILESSCILSFKGNVELSFAIHLSNFRSKPDGARGYYKYAFYNGNMVFLQSFIIGFFVGLIGAAYCKIRGGSNFEICVKVLVVSILSCIVTTFLFVVSLVAAIEFTSYFDLDSENFIMPLLNSVIDYLIVRFLIDFSITFQKIDLENTILIGFLLVAFAFINSFFSMNAEMTIPVQSIKVLSFAFFLSVISGYLVDFFAKRFKFLPVAYPFLAGMSATIAFIFLHRLFSATLGRRSSLRSSHLTLLVISAAISTLYAIFATLMGLNDSFLFSALFVSLFVAQTYLLLIILEKIVDVCKSENKDVSVFALPIISSIADIIGVMLLLLAGIIIHSVKVPI